MSKVSKKAALQRLSYFLAFSFLFFFPASAASSTINIISELQKKSVADSRYWHVLLHYRSPLVGSTQSESDGPEFFLHPNGMHDPLAELNADIEAFAPDSTIRIGNLKQHPQCAFPERWRFIKESLNPGYPNVECKEFQTWKTSFNAKSLTLVFAAPYMGSPASLFGHTFLRIDSKPRTGHSQKLDYLDYAIGFEAQTGADGGVSFAIKGLLGMYPGRFFQFPYYLKVNSYTNLDARDLWEYELNFSEEQIERVLNHLWELGSTYFNYFFFDENCSYHLLSLLEVGDPELHLRENFTFMTVPADTIRVLNENARIIRKRTYRPSILATLESRMSHFTDQDSKDFELYRNDAKSATEAVSTLALDALLDWQKYQSIQKGSTIEESDKSLDPHLLRLRAKRVEPPLELELQQKTMSAPEAGHKSTKISLRTTWERESGSLGFEFRPVFHDYLDSDSGYLPNSSLTLMRTTLDYRFQNPSALRVEDITFAEVSSISPKTQVRESASWTLGTGLTRLVDTFCDDCINTQIRGGYGYSLKILENTNGVLLARSNADIGYPLPLGYRLSLGSEFLLVSKFSKHVKSILSASYLRHLDANFEIPAETWSFKPTLVFANQSFDIRVNWEHTRTLFRTESRLIGSYGYYY